MGSELKLDTGVATAATNSVADTVSAMQQTLKRINGDVLDARAYWQGDGNVAFVATADEWGAEGERLSRLLDELQQTLQSGYKSYNAGDEDNSQSFRGLASAGGLSLPAQ